MEDFGLVLGFSPEEEKNEVNFDFPCPESLKNLIPLLLLVIIKYTTPTTAPPK